MSTEPRSGSRRRTGPLVALGYVATIVAANWATTRWPDLSVLALHIPGGSFAAGLAFTFRNLLQDTCGRAAVLVAIGSGTGLAWLIASPRIATASMLAFAASECIAFVVYTALRYRPQLVAVGAANTAGLLVDSALFVSLAFATWTALPGQITGKSASTLLALGTQLLYRRCRPPVAVAG
jgi:queuosine precursor transporter